MHNNSNFSQLDASVEGVKSTANDILRMKIHLAVKKYIQDPFVIEMDPKRSHHKTYLPLINRGVWSRIYAFNQNILNVLNHLKEIEYEEEINFIDLGAGFNTLYFYLQEHFEKIKYVEVDYDDNTCIKIEHIKKSELLKKKISDDFDNKVTIKGGNLTSENYFIINCDILKTENLIERLKGINIDFTKPTIVLSECLLVYLDKLDTIDLLKQINQSFKNVIFFLYDLIGPEDNFGKEMEINLADRNIRIPGFEQVPNCEAQKKRLLDSNFQDAKVVDMLDYYRNYINKQELHRIEKLEFLDELEEFNLLQKHSCFGVAVKIEDKDLEDLKAKIDLFSG